ncbi:coxsackievirus and adenovirus receptor homolog [Cololabis saira]|uniref:coxsackievirus and adenovirus receptor homolog n=1 Tax=Cololabis saira TaxID=129043 RepID=UPI002AD3272D|nr:coxsackievirus and adenovirus receptor homolog [Cololabis saira]
MLSETFTEGMKVTSVGSQTVLKAMGESVTLGCSYTPEPFDAGELDIEWSVVSPDTTKKDQMIMSYTSGTRYYHGNHVFAERLSFAAGDPSKGDASLSISQLSPPQSATYRCKVKKSPGVDTRKMSLVVMVKPSAPKCWVEGGQLVGEALSLNCRSTKGSTPLKYTWRRERADPMPAGVTQNGATGELKISNHSQSFAGAYLCEVNNAVGAERCRINLKADKPPNRAAVIVGTVVGSLLLVFILLVFIGLLYWKLRSRHSYDKEVSNEIREDAAPPESRPGSRHTHRSSGQQSEATYCQVDGSDRNLSSTGYANTPSSIDHGFTPIKYDSKYGYPV